MPVVDFEGSKSPDAEKLRDICDLYGVELFVGLMEARRVMVRTKGRGALGTVHVADLEHLEKRLRGWGLRPLDGDGLVALALEIAKLDGPAETVPFDLAFEEPEVPETVEDLLKVYTDTDAAEAMAERYAQNEAEARAYEGVPWEQPPAPQWFQDAMKSSEEPLDRDGLLCIGYDVVDLAKVSRVGWEPRDETWNKEVPAKFKGILHLYLDGTRLSIPEEEEEAAAVTRAWVKLTARRNMHGSTV